ncbi:MAG TPA: type 4a pilus biogenesis protein PilO [Patescibacteria group bacterium]|nr:type 4a pilus biogenesis protein PilO [Patescibacteria group bacterium]
MDLSGVTKVTAKAESSLEIAKYSSLAVPVISILVSFMVLLMIVWPKFSQALQIKNSNVELAQKTDSLKQKATILASLDKTELEKQVVAAEQLFPSDKNVFLLISQIEKAAGGSGVLLNRVETAPGSAQGSSGKPSANPASASSAGAQPEIAPNVEVSVSLTSGYSSLLQFLNNVLTIPRVVSISDLSVSASSSEGSSQLKVSLNITAYFKQMPTDLGSIETPVAELSDSEKARLKQIIDTGLAAAATASQIEQVPVGRADIFAPF